MENPYRPPKPTEKRVFKTPIILPLSIAMVILIYAAYIFLHTTNAELGALAYVKTVSFEVFILCDVGIVLLILYNKKLIDIFLLEHPTIENKQSLERLKPIVRTNMYSSLFLLLFLALGSLTAIMAILNHDLIKGVIVAILSVITAIIINWYNPSERKVKHIETEDEQLEKELNAILQCWMHKPFPNF
ncbi:hypothetical protein [Saccharophagus degradans]|uniref:Uncharacterized protein n=1 Tax=Saccharophagus degradans (strain 2-40 / ATCC 43961 / DSM 17024) TaxID=203122 RepID=Q21MW2_SACD2|nr:hypothetical protein [Saccharophagus degradans]ABD79967.1 hypothetical protein Sde_0705 [Saccharophagus degradans 2-40]